MHLLTNGRTVGEEEVSVVLRGSNGKLLCGHAQKYRFVVFAKRCVQVVDAIKKKSVLEGYLQPNVETVLGPTLQRGPLL